MKFIYPILILILLAGCQTTQIDSFEECIEAGNPVQESYPRQCTANGETFTENISKEYFECTSRPDACTKEYKPVCGMIDNQIRCITTPCPSNDAVDFSNSCTACSQRANGYYEGKCVDNLFVVCQNTTTGFDAKQFAKDRGGICVEVCPGNYDTYTTQTGIKLCIQHYGIEDISQWEICERSSKSCNCVKAYETTSGVSIENPEYRCVPERYAERLLFRAGQDKLDEDGKKSVLIA